jgi:predicted RNA-binding Zn-ribbon protein involved in translation (DUF1610 family)
MKTSAALVIVILLILGSTLVVLGRFYQVPVVLTGPFNERHDISLGYASPFTYTIVPGNAPFLTYNLTSGTVVRANMTISGGSGDDINFYIKDSAGSTVFNPGRVSHIYSYQFVAQKNDSYRVYMDNSFSYFSTKTVYYRVIEAYYMDIDYGPRTTYLPLVQSYPWLEWIGIGAILFPTGIITFFVLRILNNNLRRAAQARVQEKVRLEAEQQLAAKLEQQRLKAEEEQRRIAMRTRAKQDADNLLKAGRYEDAAKLYEQLEMWNEAGECRRLARTTYVVAADVKVGKDGISVKCPHCGSSERLESKVSEVTCRHCGSTYYIPKKILDMI